jgi:hypothetical protein
MVTQVFRTNLKCQSCVSKVASFLNADQDIAEWSVRTDDERKLLSVTGTRLIPDSIRSVVGKAGFDVFEEIGQPAAAQGPTTDAAPPTYKTYFPLALIFLYLVGFVFLSQLRAGRVEWMETMNAFMGGFFIVFSFFKLLDLRGFADAYRSYDIIAERVPVYGYIYPFLELGLGICYFVAFAPVAINIANCAVMSIGAIGVVRSLMNKTRIRCACLGTGFNLPMSRVTLIEDLLMVSMSAIMIGAIV